MHNQINSHFLCIWTNNSVCYSHLKSFYFDFMILHSTIFLWAKYVVVFFSSVCYLIYSLQQMWMVIRLCGYILCVSVYIYIFFFFFHILPLWFSVFPPSCVLRSDFNFFPLKHINVAFLLFSLCLPTLKGWLHWTSESMFFRFDFVPFAHSPFSRARSFT